MGKTTLAKSLVESRDETTHFFDLEWPPDLARLEDSALALGSLRGLVVLDEVQRLPGVFPVLRVLADRAGTPARFLVLGSASPDLVRQGSESLAGRVAYHHLPGISMSEAGIDRIDRLWLRGGFPRSLVADGERVSWEWRSNFVRTFLERDIPQLGLRTPSRTLDRFWSMLAHYHAQVWNASELGRAFGVSHHAVRRYLDMLESTFMVRVLKPWAANLKKRQVRAPKVYIRDTGLLHFLLGIRDDEMLMRHPKVGASWEGFVIDAVIHRLGFEDRQCYFWATHMGNEIDLVVDTGDGLRGFEVKRTSQPRLTRSMRTAMTDLGLGRIDLVHAGTESFDLAPNVRAVAIAHLLEEIHK